MNLKLLISFLLISFSTFSQEPKIMVKVSTQKIPLNKKIKVDFSVNTQGADNFKGPDFKDFTPINLRPNVQTSSYSYSFNGNKQVHFEIKYTYIIKPKHKGELTIEPASISYKGKILKSKPIKIYVTDAVIDPNDPEYIADQNVNLVTFVSNKKPYAGEPFFVEYRIYVKDVSVSLLDGKKPKFEGFWTREIDVKQNVKKTKYKGEDWNYGVIKKVMLIPTKSGKLKVGKLSCQMSVKKEALRRNFFDEIVRTYQPLCTKEFNSQDIIINVQDFPQKDKPTDFKGAVGNFDFSVKLNKNQLKANESAQIKVEVNGTGNLKSFTLPELKTPSELEVYDPEKKTETTMSSKGLKGFLRNTYTVIPVYKGKYLIPSVSFSYFNPHDKKYHTIKSEELSIEILEGKEASTFQAQENLEPVTKPKERNFKYIETKTTFVSTKATDFFGSLWYYFLLLIPLLTIPLLILIKKRSKNTDIQKVRVKKASRLVKKHLKDAKSNLGHKEAFFESLERALHNFLKAKLSIETSDISTEKIATILTDKNVKQDTINAFINTLKNCDFARYTPTTNVEMKEEYEKAQEILMELDKQL